MVIESKESRYKEYTSKLIPWLIDEIDKNPNKIIMLRVDDILNQMGPIFKKDINIYKKKQNVYIRALWELKQLFWPDQIVVNGTISGGEYLFTFRKSMPEDEAPTIGLSEFDENAYYIKEITTEIVTENPFTVSENYIKDLVDRLNIPDAAISITKIKDWTKAEYH